MDPEITNKYFNLDDNGFLMEDESVMLADKWVKSIYECNVCHSLTFNPTLHAAWHESL